MLGLEVGFEAWVYYLREGLGCAASVLGFLKKQGCPEVKSTSTWGFPKIRGTVLGVPLIRIIIFGDPLFKETRVPI